ncbi:MAG TPA: beta-N-acetylhexosaminidase [Candidatus Acidoferrales bacterium]|nr:beta-N-acetylhexosaminidase [Candidatus Acidoferrales bacterium]
MTRPAQPNARSLGTAHERFLVGFEGTSLPDELRAMLAKGLAGVVLYRRNWESIEGLRALTQEIRAAAGRPLLIGMDAEPGGAFALPEPFTPWPTAAKLGALNDPMLVQRVAHAIGTELRSVGVNLDFSPMLDLHAHADSPVTKDRSFGANPARVGAMGAAFIRGLRDAGVMACAKHYPGHGDALLDPHQHLPVFRGTERRLETMEFVPFDAAIQEGVQLIMTAHILLPEIEPKRPASLSRKMIEHTLRERMGFGGAVLADDLGMGAIRERFGVREAAVEAVRAGSDILMLCHDWSEVAPAIEAVAVLGSHAHNLAAWRASHERIEWIRDALNVAEKETAAKGLDVIGCARHRALSEQIRSLCNL